MGAHPGEMENRQGTRFAVWAPNAQAVWVVGDFNGWDPLAHPLEKDEASGIWQGFVPGALRGQHYQFRLLQRHGRVVLKSDPYAFRTEMRPAKASVIEGLQRPRGLAPAPAAQRPAALLQDAAMSVYEVHLGSWRKQAMWRWLSYEELAVELVDYAVDMGFTHIELLPIMEYPYDPSWGYQSLGIYAPTARFGTPAEFAHLIDAAHAKGLGVILDWTPSHFPDDLHGLVQFDGTALYEHLDPREGVHPDWHTLIFNLGRPEVANYLLGNALFWLEQYGVDGLRVDAVASMLYRNYSRADGAWIPNRWGGQENLESIDFLKRLNRRLSEHAPAAVRIAEESTAFPQVTTRTQAEDNQGSLGFHWKWNLGWMHDVLRYFSRDPLFRAHHQEDLTFGIMYAYSEQFILSLSHDEVVHGKASLLAKMPGDTWQRFANLRCLYALMWSYPGKKLLFMGGEWGSPIEWNHDEALPWHVLAEPAHRALQQFVKQLNHLYRHWPSLHRSDHDPEGFGWVSHDDHQSSIIVYLRRTALAQAPWDASPSNDPVLVVCNFTPRPRTAYRIGTPVKAAWRILLDSDDRQFGGSGYRSSAAAVSLGGDGVFPLCEMPWQGQAQSIEVDIPPLAVLYLVPVRDPVQCLS
jgi:1,4-alpha-glucan branching enzyme